MERFEAVIQKHETIDGAYVEIPFNVEKVFGAKRVKVKATFNGIPYRGSIVNMGGCTMLGLTQAIRKQMGKNPGDTIMVEVEKDLEERTVEMPEDFDRMLSDNPDARTFYDKLSFTKRKEYVQWIIEAKKAETRSTRIDKAIQLLNEGKPLK